MSKFIKFKDFMAINESSQNVKKDAESIGKLLAAYFSNAASSDEEYAEDYDLGDLQNVSISVEGKASKGGSYKISSDYGFEKGNPYISIKILGSYENENKLAKSLADEIERAAIALSASINEEKIPLKGYVKVEKAPPKSKNSKTIDVEFHGEVFCTEYNLSQYLDTILMRMGKNFKYKIYDTGDNNYWGIDLENKKVMFKWNAEDNILYYNARYLRI